MLLTALGSPNIDVLAITTVGGNVGPRQATKAAEEIVRRADTGTPVVASSPATFIAESVRARPGEITILAAGPLTNIARAITASPDIVPLISELVIVGGRVDGMNAGRRAPSDLNYRTDPEATAVVFESGVNLTLIHIDLCLEFRTTRNQFRDVFDGNDPLQRYIRRSTTSWRLLKRGRIVLWDLVALSWISHPDWFMASQVPVTLNLAADQTVPIYEEAAESSRFVTVPSGMPEMESYWEWIAASVRNLGGD